jgi:hypothetical protein
MNAQIGLPNRIQSRITPSVAESIMELAPGSVQAVAWLVLQAEADGVEVADIATNLSVSVEQIQALKEATTGKQGEECEQTWLKGIVAIRTSQQLNTQSIATGWDALESMALEKLNQQMQELKTAGDPDKMLAIAVAANKATRRMNGEGGGRGSRGPVLGRGDREQGHGDIELNLSGGNIGSIRLQLSPRIQSQLSDPGRVIEGVANNAANGKRLTDSLQMLKLGETRQLVEEAAKPKSNLETETKQFNFDELPSTLDE